MGNEKRKVRREQMQSGFENPDLPGPISIFEDFQHLALRVAADRQLQLSAAAGPGPRACLGRLQLFRRRNDFRMMLDAVHGADLGADVAVDTAVGVNPVLAVGLVEVMDGVCGAGTAAPPAVDAAVLVDYISHGEAQMERESFDELGMSEVFAAERSDFGRLSLRWRVSSFDELRMSGLRGRMMGW